MSGIYVQAQRLSREYRLRVNFYKEYYENKGTKTTSKNCVLKYITCNKNRTATHSDESHLTVYSAKTVLTMADLTSSFKGFMGFECCKQKCNKNGLAINRILSKLLTS